MIRNIEALFLGNFTRLDTINLGMNYLEQVDLIRIARHFMDNNLIVIDLSGNLLTAIDDLTTTEQMPGRYKLHTALTVSRVSASVRLSFFSTDKDN